MRASTHLMAAPHAPEIRLHLAHEAIDLWQRTEDELCELGLPPPFWAFAWAGGQALARYILDRPDIVAGRTVFDVASGSGLVAIAAALSGAARVEASDIDEFAIAAIAVNAAANGVAIHIRPADMVGADEGWDVVLAGDVSYERDMAGRITDWLEGLHRRGCQVLLGDPGRSYLARDRLTPVATYQVSVTRALEDADVKQTSVWRFNDRS